MHRYLKVILVLLLFVAAGLAMGQAGVLAAGKPKLAMTEDTVYIVPEAGDEIQVHSIYTIVDQDPSTRKKKSGRYYFYNSLSLGLPKGAVQIHAERADGKKLKIRRTRKRKFFDVYQIRFGRKLFYKQKIKIKLRYVIKSERPPFYVSKNVVRFPGFLAGDKGWLSVELPADFKISLDSEKCWIREADGIKRVWCGGEKPITDTGRALFYLDAYRPATERVLVSDPIPMQEQELSIKVRYFEGEEDWAQKVVDTLSKSLPVTEQVMGFPYQGPAQLELVQSTKAETMGYAGLYEDEDTVLIRPGATREVIVHEGAHLWSAPFDSRWLIEGWAEWSARETLRRLKMKPEYPYSKLPRRDKIKMPLQNWEWIGPETEDEWEVEDYGYAKATAAIARLVKIVGLKHVQEVNRAFFSASIADDPHFANTTSYFEAMMRATKKKKQVRKLWASMIFDAAHKKQLERRDKMMKKVRALETRVAKQGWQMPQSVQDDLNNWLFYSLNNDLRSAGETLDVWQEMMALYDKLGWQADDLVQRQFETSSDWKRTLRAVKHRRRIAQQALAVQARLDADNDLAPDVIARVRALLQETGEAMRQGESYRADKLIAQAQALAGLP